MIGRKRIDRTANNLQKFNVYIKVPSTSELNNYIMKCIEIQDEFEKISNYKIDYLKYIDDESDLNLWYVKNNEIIPNRLYEDKIRNLK